MKFVWKLFAKWDSLLFCPHAMHGPSFWNTGMPSLYKTAVLNSIVFICSPRLGVGTTFNQSPACGKATKLRRALSRKLSTLSRRHLEMWVSMRWLICFWFISFMESLLNPAPDSSSSPRTLLRWTRAPSRTGCKLREGVTCSKSLLVSHTDDKYDAEKCLDAAQRPRPPLQVGSWACNQALSSRLEPKIWFTVAWESSGILKRYDALCCAHCTFIYGGFSDMKMSEWMTWHATSQYIGFEDCMCRWLSLVSLPNFPASGGCGFRLNYICVWKRQA